MRFRNPSPRTLGFRGLGLRALGLGCTAEGLGFRVQSFSGDR